VDLTQLHQNFMSRKRSCVCVIVHGPGLSHDVVRAGRFCVHLTTGLRRLICKTYKRLLVFWQPFFSSCTHNSRTSTAIRGSPFWFLHAQEQKEQVSETKAVLEFICSCEDRQLGFYGVQSTSCLLPDDSVGGDQNCDKWDD